MPETKPHKRSSSHSPPPPWGILLGLYLLSALLLALVASRVPGPLDVDGAYYLLVARNLARGRGLVVDAIWHFFHPTSSWPQPAGDLWMPLPSLLMAPAFFFGQTFRAAQALQVALAAFLPLLAFLIARDNGAERPWALLAALCTLFAGTTTVHWVDSDCYTAYALVGGAALYAIGRARRDRRWWIVGGALGGLAALTRNDGILLLAVLWLYALLLKMRRHRQPFPWRHLLLGSALFLLPVLLWGLRNQAVFGQPSAAPLSFLATMRDYSTLFAYRPQPDWAGFWNQGWGTLLDLRAQALGASLAVLAANLQFWGLVPLLAVAATLRRRPGLWPAFLHLAGLFAALVLFLPLLVLHGTWSRSLTAFLPTAYAAVALGVRGAARWLLRWRPALPQRLLRRTFLALGAAAAVLVGLAAMAFQLEPARAHPQTWQQIGAWLQEEAGPDEVIMAQDPMAVRLYAGQRAIGIPHNDESTLLRVARAYNVTKIVLVERFQSLLPQTLQDLYAAGTSRPPFTLLWAEGEIQIYELAP